MSLSAWIKNKKGGAGMNRTITWSTIILLLALFIILGGCQASGEGEEGEENQWNIPVSSIQSHLGGSDFGSAEEEEIIDLDDLLTRKNYLIVFDSSGSMDGTNCAEGNTKLVAAKQVLTEFAHSLDEKDNLGLVIFNARGIRLEVPLGTENREHFINRVNATWSDGGTPLADSMEIAYDNLAQQAKRQLGYGEYHLVVITDGEANENQDPGEMVDTILDRSSVIIHAVGFCIEEGHSLNQPGRILYSTASNPQELQQSLQDVLAEAPVFEITTFP